MVTHGTVPRLWPDSTIVCLASGPSLTQADVDFCRDRATVLVIKDAVRLAPWADVLYACDGKWWRHYGPTLTFAGLRFTLDLHVSSVATALKNTGETGLETDPSGLRTGKNSGYQAINLAVHLGAKKIVLLGYDMQPGPDHTDHWFGAHPWRTRPPYGLMKPMFQSLVEPLRALGIQVFNATRRTALTCFPMIRLEEAFV